MAPAKLDDLSVAIGGLKKEVEILSRTMRENHEATTEEHRKVHDIVVATSESVRLLAAKVKTMEPLTEDYREKRAEKRGMWKSTRWLYATSGGVIAASAVKILDFVLPRH